jgi:hypothetical protein
MKLFSAKDARILVDKGKSAGLNDQVQHVLDGIRYRAERGDRSYVLDDPAWRLFEPDYSTLENLGFFVRRPKMHIYRPTGAPEDGSKDQQYIEYAIIYW